MGTWKKEACMLKHIWLRVLLELVIFAVLSTVAYFLGLLG